MRAIPTLCCLVLAAKSAAAQRADLLQRMGVADLATMERMIMVPMRDGVRLATAVIRPRAGDKLPTVLVRTPYLKEGEVRSPLFARLVREGYAVVIQNERGTEWSEGTHRFLAGARTDGYDALTWIAAQPWSNGRVGTIGCSSSAEDQLGLAAMNHPAHRAMIPMSAGAGIGAIPGVSSQGLFYKGGVPQLGPWAGWYVGSGHANRPKLPAGISQDERIRLADFYSSDPKPEAERYGVGSVSGAIRGDSTLGVLGYLPSRDVLRASGAPETDFDTFMTMSPTDVRWLAIDFIRDGDKPKVPALHVNGWHDVGAFETVKLFEYLRDVPNQYFLQSNGRAQGLKGTGRLILEAPGEQPADTVVSDPMHPVPSRGGGCCDRDAVRDQRQVEARSDVLIYSTDPLKDGIAVMGDVKVMLYVSSSALDTDVGIKLVDVYPDGRAFNLYDAMQRLRYREGYDRAVPLEPGKVYPVEITGLVAGNYFAPGHRIRIEVAGSNFPNFERNLQTGGNNYDETRGVVAINRVHHAGGKASYIELPTVPR